MSQVSVTIDGRKYRLACNEGEEARLELLAGTIDEKIGEMRKTFGEIGDQRLVIMAALTLADSLTEARDEAAAARKRSTEAEQRVQALASNLDQLGSRLDPWPRAWQAKPRLDPLNRSAPSAGWMQLPNVRLPSRTTALMPQGRGEASHLEG